MPQAADISYRDATLDDIDAVARLGARFFDEAEWSDVTSWDHETVCITLRNLIEQDGGILVVCEREGVIIGMAGGLVHPAYFNRHHLTGQELFWWVEPRYRGGAGSALLNSLEASARERGAQSWAMIALAKVRPDAVGKIYERRGYRPSERTYIKALGV